MLFKTAFDIIGRKSPNSDFVTATLKDHSVTFFMIEINVKLNENNSKHIIIVILKQG